MLHSGKIGLPSPKGVPARAMFFLTAQKLSRRIVKGMNRGAQIKLERWPHIQVEVHVQVYVASSWLALPATAVTPCSQIGLLSHLCSHIGD
jgi:hypothetical protein